MTHLSGLEHFSKTWATLQHVKDFEDLVRTVVTLCNPEEQERLREMEDWIVKNEVHPFKKHKSEEEDKNMS